MALNAQGKVAVRGTIKEAWQDVRANWVLGTVLFTFILFPLVLLTHFGIFDNAFQRATDYQTLAERAEWTFLSQTLWFVLGAIAGLLITRIFLLKYMVNYDLSFLTFTKYLSKAVFLSMIIFIPFFLSETILGLYLIQIEEINTDSLNDNVLKIIFSYSILLLTNAFILFCLALVITVLTVRFMPALCGTAIGYNTRLRTSWHKLRGNTWRAFAAMIPALSLLIIYSILVGLLSGYLGPTIGISETSVMQARLQTWTQLILAPLVYLGSGWCIAVTCRIFRDLWPETAEPEA